MNEERAQSEVIGIVLLLGITLTSIGVIFLLAQPILTDATDTATIDRVENEMRALDSRLTAASIGTAENESLTFNFEDGQLRSDSNTTTLTVKLDGNTLYDKNVGKIEYTKSSESIAYEAGGLWRRDALNDGSFMVKSPDFDFDGETLTLPVYNVTTDVGYSGSQTLSVRAGDVTREFPDTEENPVNGNVNVTVQSDYYAAWSRYFEDEFNATVSVDDSANEVEAELLALRTPNEIDTAGVSRKEYERPSNDPFDGDIVDGVSLPSVDSTVERYVEYAETNPVTSQSNGPVTYLSECNNTCTDADSVVYSNGDYTMSSTTNGGIEEFDVTDNSNGGNITVVVDGDLTVEDMDLTNAASENTLKIVTTGNLVFAEGFQIQNSVGADPHNIVFHTPSNREVIFEGNGGNGFGVVYAPDALVSLSEMGDSTWTGPLVGKVIDAGGVDSDASVTFGGSVDVNQMETRKNLYVTVRNVGVE
ncbi:MAG: archaellin/type IV pilin N-terminal domain-containing protein [Halobacteriales archaeon]|nr:archaellin/type IV pilin N-terminal domain-containing protein [Halobacteriales archaeon]